MEIRITPQDSPIFRPATCRTTYMNNIHSKGFYAISWDRLNQYKTNFLVVIKNVGACDGGGLSLPNNGKEHSLLGEGSSIKKNLSNYMLLKKFVSCLKNSLDIYVSSSKCSTTIKTLIFYHLLLKMANSTHQDFENS